jgi:UDP-galactopyranose mutase
VRQTRVARAAVGDSPCAPDLVCFSHLRWDFVFQRPQQLMMRAASARRIFFIEEPLIDLAPGQCTTEVKVPHPNLHVVVPHHGRAGGPADRLPEQQRAVDWLLHAYDVSVFVAWYWTPMALPFTRHLRPVTTVFDCMDELSGFAGASDELHALETELLARADIVLTGGASLFDAKRPRHHNVYLFPSSVDVPHFAQARHPIADPSDQAEIPHPRLGYFGVLDERLDLALIDGVARERPEWHLVFVGPVAKIDETQLPRRANIHYLGMKDYADLPRYLAGWDVALLPFAHNSATRFISPTKTPEYLAAGRPVVSTGIRDVVRPYGERGLVRIADDVPDFVAALTAALNDPAEDRCLAADAFLEGMSWDTTWRRMSDAIDQTYSLGSGIPAAPALLGVDPRDRRPARIADIARGSVNGL